MEDSTKVDILKVAVECAAIQRERGNVEMISSIYRDLRNLILEPAVVVAPIPDLDGGDDKQIAPPPPPTSSSRKRDLTAK